ncbi:MAG: hypothetical protein NT154_36230 [Verrucomicrobia bacterium]|nr:hypothetical protein [Verrucomicrobiota bacterium]
MTTHRSLGRYAVVATLLFGLAWRGEAQPSNDLCAGATALTNGVAYSQNTSGATSIGDPDPSGYGGTGSGVWFSFTPAVSGQVSIGTCGSGFDTEVAVYTGCCGALSLLTYNHSDGPLCAGSQASVNFGGTAGTTYYILAAGFWSATGNLTVTASVLPINNDLCSQAFPLTNGITYIMSTTEATSAGDPLPDCATNSGNGVWFTFAPAFSGWVLVTTCESTFDTTLQVFSGPCEGLTAVGCNDDAGFACGGTQASVFFAGNAGTPYRILVGGKAGQTGQLKIMARAVPINDICSGAVALTNEVAYSQSTTDATSIGDPDPSGYGGTGSGVWFSFTPAVSGQVSIGTCGSGFDTEVAVYTGSCGALSLVAYNHDNGPLCGGSQASVNFGGTAGTTYYILAAGFWSATGNLTIAAAVVPNDLCSGAVELTNGIPYTMNTAFATSVGDPSPVCRPSAGRGVWFMYTSSQPSYVKISTCDSSYDTALQVYMNGCGGLTPVACDDNDGLLCGGNRASVRFASPPATNYRILVAGAGGQTGNLNIVVTEEAPSKLDVGTFGTNIIVIWPSGTLESATNLTPTIRWSEVGTGSFFIRTPPGPAEFFRVRNP